MATKKGGLGKGLDALFVDNSSSENAVTVINISEIEPNKDQPRKYFDEAALADLADSINEHGVLQPLLVRQLDNGRFQIVAGERRWRASRMAGLTELPVIVREMSDTTAMEIALIENLQRENLNIIEEALGYKALMDEYDYTQEQISKRVGKSRPVIANALRLLKLPQDVIPFVKNGDISSGHARALLSFDNDNIISEIADKIIKKGLSVREVEKMAKLAKAPQQTADKQPMEECSWGESIFKEIEIALQNELGRRIKVKNSGESGMLEIEFFSEEDLKDIANTLTESK